MTRPQPTTIALAAALLLAQQGGAHAQTARVVDGDGIRIAGVHYRLCGIDAPEMNTQAGRDAKRALERLVAGKRVICRPVGDGTPCDGRSERTSYNRVVGQCFIGDLDLAGEMVRLGHAEDWSRFSGGYYRPKLWWEFWR